MSTTFISTNAVSATLRRSVMKSQVLISEATKEATTGRHFDVGLALGALNGRNVVLRAEFANMDKIIDTNALVTGRLNTTDNVLDQLIETAKTFQQEIAASRNNQSGASMVLPSARANLESLIASLNVSLDGQYLFAGIDTETQPIGPYGAGSPSKTAIDAAFVATFGFPQTSPLVAGISGAAMQNFLDTQFAAEFDDPAWGANWSSASDQVMSSRISTSEVIDTSVSANEQGFRKLAMAYTMLSDIGATGMSEAAFQVTIDSAWKMVGDAIYDLALVQGKIGTAQERTDGATDKLHIQKDLVTSQINAMEQVDPAEASHRVTALETQIDMALALTARIQKLSIINYL